MYYTKCPECGAALDPGEVCDCPKVLNNSQHYGNSIEPFKESGKTEDSNYKYPYKTA